MPPNPNLGILNPPFFPLTLTSGAATSTSNSGDDPSNSAEGRFTSAALSCGRSRSTSPEIPAEGALAEASTSRPASTSADGPDTSASALRLGNLTYISISSKKIMTDIEVTLYYRWRRGGGWGIAIY